MNRNLLRGMLALLLVTFACRPVLAIGWNEFVIFFLLFLILLGPPLFRFLQRWGNVRRQEKKDK
jgi:hypothetical protein